MKKCELCGKDHEDWQAHVFDKVYDKQLVVDPGGSVRVEHLTGASNSASNRELESASNERGSEGEVVGGGISEKVSGRKTKQRWGREKYNKYQRDLMRKRRAVKK